MDMIEGVDLKKAQQAISAKLSGGDYTFMAGDKLFDMVGECLRLDGEFMRETGVDEGNVYDDDKAYEKIFNGLCARFPEMKMYCMRFTEDYMDAFEAFLDDTGMLAWDDGKA
jgi:hypothetical protein